MENESYERSVRNKPIDPQDIRGVYTAMITPMLAGNGIDNEIDYDKFFKLIEIQARHDISGIVVAGTTGQSSTLSHREHVELVRTAYRYVKDRHPRLQFIVGAGSNSTREAISLSHIIEDSIGPSTFLHVTGYYNNPSQEGIIEHYERLASCIDKSNILLYNVPGRTGSNIDPDTVKVLARTKNIIGMKIACGDKSIGYMKRLFSKGIDPKRFILLSGEDRFIARMMQLGARGVISAGANIIPKYLVNLINTALYCEPEKAADLQDRIDGFLEQVVYCSKNPVPLAELFDSEVRLPLFKSKDLKEKLELRMKKLEHFYPVTREELGIELS